MNVRHIQVGLANFGYANAIRMGLISYRDQFANWTLRNTGTLLKPFPTGGLDGAVVAIQTEQLKRIWTEIGVPVVNVASSLADLPFPSVLIDNVLVGDLAADHFLERQFENFAYVGPEASFFSHQRLRGFRQKLESRGAACLTFDPGPEWADKFYNAISIRAMGAWLKGLPRPCAIFCCDDACAFRLVDRILEEGWEVPAQFGVLGVNNDEVLCSFARRPISSVTINGVELGFQAAKMLDQLIQFGEVEPSLIHVPPIRVAARISTDITAHNDEVVARALQFIRNHITEPILVQDVAKGIGVSKRLLERQFGLHLEHGPAEEIVRQRMRRAKHLLTNTNWPIYRIAAACGYADNSLFSTSFRRLEGLSPKAWREQAVRKSKHT